MRRWFVAAAMACCASVFAQKPVELPKITETVEVVVVNLDAIVTDRDGRHVRGLTAADFEVFEDGKSQPITNFSEIVAAEATHGVAAENPPRAIVVFIDTLSLDFFDRKRVLTQLGDFFAKSVRPGDEAMIVSWNRKLTVAVPPTADVQRLRQGVASIMKEVSANALSRALFGAGSMMLIGDGPRPAEFGLKPHEDFMGGDAIPRGNLFSLQFRVQQKLYDARQTVNAIRSVLSRMSGVNGRKILLLVSEGFDIDVMDAYDSRTNTASVAQSANAAGVTIYGIHPAGLSSAIDVTDTGPGASLMRQRTEDASISALTYLSDRTGGAVTARTNGFARAFDRIASDLSSYYSIGYRTRSAKKGGERSVVIRARRKDLAVRSRRGFVDRSAEAVVREKVIANLFFSSDQADAMRIAARTGKLQRVRGGVKTPVELMIPLTALTFLPVGDQYAGGFSVFVAAADARENTSSVSEQKHRLSFAAADLPKTSGAYYTYTFDLVANKGSRISIAVVDELSKSAGYARLQVPRSVPAR
jgi:VWFA-related protein